MTILTQGEIAKFRKEFASYPQAQEVLDTILEVDGNVEDAAQLMSVRSGQVVTMGDTSLSDSVKKAQLYLCEEKIKSRWTDINDVLGLVKEFLPAPFSTVVFVVIILSKMGLRNLCKEIKPVS